MHAESSPPPVPPPPRPRRRWAWLLLTWLALLGLAMALDTWTYHHVVYDEPLRHDWARLLRVMGFLPTWLLAAGALILIDAAPKARGGKGASFTGWQRGLLLAFAPTLGGLVAELAKLLIRRERPALHDGAYGFRPWSVHPFSTSNLGMPSSHALVAFAAAFMLCRLFPRASVLWLSLAAGCGLTRVLAQDHFLSDVVLAAMLGQLVAATLWRWRRYELAKRGLPLDT